MGLINFLNKLRDRDDIDIKTDCYDIKFSKQFIDFEEICGDNVTVENLEIKRGRGRSIESIVDICNKSAHEFECSCIEKGIDYKKLDDKKYKVTVNIH